MDFGSSPTLPPNINPFQSNSRPMSLGVSDYQNGETPQYQPYNLPRSDSYFFAPTNPQPVSIWNSQQSLGLDQNSRLLKPKPQSQPLFSSFGSQAVVDQHDQTVPLQPVDPSEVESEREDLRSIYAEYLEIKGLTYLPVIYKKAAFRRLMKLERRLIVESYQAGLCTGFSSLGLTGLERVKELMADQVQSSELYGWLFCTMTKAFTNKAFDFNANVDAVAQTITELTRVGKEGIFGHVWVSQVRGLDGLVLVKTFGTRNGPDEITHEFFVGYVLNQLRAQIPNFMYVYGMFRCPKPETGKPACPPILHYEQGFEKNKRNYLLMELVVPPAPFNQGYDVKDLCMTCSPIEFMNVYLQVICALAVAYELYDFTHYDLHSGNILLQRTKNNESVFIKYDFEGEVTYVKTNVIAKIVDYGQSTVTIVRDHQYLSFGNIIQTSSGTSRIGDTNPFEGNPLHDIYKISGFMLYGLLAQNHQTLELVYEIIARFPPFHSSVSSTPPKNFKLLDHLLVKERDAYFEYQARSNQPVTPSDTGLPFRMHLKHVTDNYPGLQGLVLYDQPDQSARVLNCENETCLTRSQIERAVNL